MASESGVSEMMAIEGFAVIRNDAIIAGIHDSKSKADSIAKGKDYLFKKCGVPQNFEVRPICWSVERGEFIAVPDSISI